LHAYLAFYAFLVLGLIAAAAFFKVLRCGVRRQSLLAYPMYPFDTAFFKNGWNPIFQMDLLYHLIFCGGLWQQLLKRMLVTSNNRLYVKLRRCFIAGSEIYVIGHPALAQQIFEENKKCYQRVEAPKYTGNNLIYSVEYNRCIVFAGDGPSWSNSKVAMCPFLMNSPMHMEQELVESITCKHIARFAAKSGQAQDLLSMCLIMTTDILLQGLFRYEIADSEVLHEIALACVMDVVLQKPTAFKDLDQIAVIRKHAALALSQAPDGTLGQLIQDSPRLSKEEKLHNAMLLFVALTPAFAAFWSMCEILKHESCEGEISEAACRDARFRSQCMKESMRLHPPVPLIFPRVATQDHTLRIPQSSEGLFLDGVFGKSRRPGSLLHVKKGSLMFVLPTVMHTDARYWKNPFQWIPKRWQNDPWLLSPVDGNTFAKRAVSQGGLPDSPSNRAPKRELQSIAIAAVHQDTIEQNSYGKPSLPVHRPQAHAKDGCDHSYVPFGAGVHTCLGRKFAVKVADMMLKALLEKSVKFDGETPAFLGRPLEEQILAKGSAYNFPPTPVFVRFGNSARTPLTPREGY